MDIKPPLNANLQATPGKTGPVGLKLNQMLEGRLTASQANLQTDQIVSRLPNGQQLQATILKLAGNQVTLRTQPSSTNLNPNILTLDTRQLFVNTEGTEATTLKEGAQIQLQVIKTGNVPSFLLTPIGNSTEQELIEAIKQLLPIQTSALPLVTQLQQVLPQLQADARIGETLKHLAQKMLVGLTSHTNLTNPALIKKAFFDSGLFLESKLAALLSGKPQIVLQNDFKFNLNTLILLLNQELSKQSTDKSDNLLKVLQTSLQKARGTLAGLTMDQLNSLPKDESVKQTWILELPFLNRDQADLVKLEIEQDKETDQDKPHKNWAVNVIIRPPNLDTIHCRLSCYDGSVNTRFWSENINTVELINAHLDYLKQQFEDKGLTTGFMDAQQGQTTPVKGSTTPITQLLSEKA